MRSWKPMKGSVGAFALETVRRVSHLSVWQPGDLTFEERNVMMVRFCERIGEEYRDYAHARWALTDERWPLLLDEVAASTARREVRFKALWLEEPEPRANEKGAWFKLDSGPIVFRGPARSPHGRHFLCQYPVHFATRPFVECVREHGLTGLGVLPLPEPMTPGEHEWFEVYAERALGRGLDHPLFDEAKSCEYENRAPSDPARRGARTTAEAPYFRDDVRIDDPVVARMVAAFPPYCREKGPNFYWRGPHFWVRRPERYVREFVPEADFAFDGWSWKPSNGPGPRERSPGSLVCNARARAALMEAGLFKPAWFEPVRTVPEAEADAEIFDRRGVHPLPAYTFEEAVVERGRRVQMQLHALSSPTASAAPAFRDLDDAVATLERRLADGSATWTPARALPDWATIASSELMAMTPAAWRRLAPLLPVEVDVESDDEDERFEWEFDSPEWNVWGVDRDDDPGEGEPDADGPAENDEAADRPCEEDLVVGSVNTGDWYSFRVNWTTPPEDAPVTLWDHETCCPHERWKTVLAFVAALVSAADRAAAQGEEEDED